MAPPRGYFLDRALLYLFSYNTEIEHRTQKIGIVPEGARYNESATVGDSRVYNVFREKSQGGLGPGFKAVTGRLVAGFDRALYRTDDVIIGDVQATIETDDGELIGTRYRATAYLRPGGYEAYVAGIDRAGTEHEPVQAPIVITPSFETEAPAYQFLVTHRCVGFGRADVIRSEIRRLSYDIYAMT
jgi:uncharacterized protein DUF3237